MTTAIETIESVVIGGDLSKLSSEQRLSYYKSVCSSLGLNPLTKPFDYITLNGKLTLYVRKDAADQLRKLHDVSITKLERERIDSIYTVTAYAQDKQGRQDSSIGAVNIDGLKGDALANAIMKAETKAKRRVTLSLCGLGMLDETELETIKEYAQPLEESSAELIAENIPMKSMPIEVANAMARKGSDNKNYGSCTDSQLGFKMKAIEKKLQGNLESSEQDELMGKLEDISIILDWRKLHPVLATQAG